MKHFRIIIIILMGSFLLTTTSCVEVKFSEEEQVYPAIDFENIQEIKIYSHSLKNSKKIIDSDRVDLFKKYFNDSSNYYKKELVKLNDKKPIYVLTFIDESKTTKLYVHPTAEKNKIELAFFDDLNPDDPKKFRKYNRFYMTDELLELLGNESN
ncbi:MAG TPA: hypothetical protein VFD78_01640 [Chitinophagaceae bacterium]|nr:hypothetical protein [Chitinophagaceae bacterium]